MTLVNELIEKVDDASGFLPVSDVKDADLVIFEGYNSNTSIALFVYNTAFDGKQLSGFMVENDDFGNIRDSIISTDYKRGGFKSMKSYRLKRRGEKIWKKGQRESPDYNYLKNFVKEKLSE